MASIILRRSDVFPVGTSVAVWPRQARREGGPPGTGGAAAIASAAVDAAGLLTVTNAGIVDNARYTAYALVSGEHRYIDVTSSTTGHNPGSDWAGVVAARRSGAGTA